ncbi:reactive oxygen species modulator 1 [Vigna unguiculata]|uniref:reactive oxygen species modulator 1 n=1 Tax=Vigna unguiculata TaxID=3917 RepID=UPI0010170266|nr:reactive oxygen species modulator 1 [Vigna unguiculata]
MSLVFPFKRLFSPKTLSSVYLGLQMARDSCLTRVVAGAAMGGAVGGAVGAVYGTYEAIRYKVPGLMKIRHIGQTTLGSAAIFGLFLGAGSLIHCGKSY